MLLLVVVNLGARADAHGTFSQPQLTVVACAALPQVSGFYLFYLYYDGPHTVQVLITNTLLGINKLRVQLTSAMKSHKQALAISATLMTPLSYNVIDTKLVDGMADLHDADLL